LGVVVRGASAAVACAILLEAARHFEPPFRLRVVTSAGFGRVIRPSDDRFQDFVVFFGGDGAERTILRVVEQKGATLRADAYHWSVLRCGNSQWNGEIIAR